MILEHFCDERNLWGLGKVNTINFHLEELDHYLEGKIKNEYTAVELNLLQRGFWPWAKRLLETSKDAQESSVSNFSSRTL